MAAPADVVVVTEGLDEGDDLAVDRRGTPFGPADEPLVAAQRRSTVRSHGVLHDGVERQLRRRPQAQGVAGAGRGIVDRQFELGRVAGKHRRRPLRGKREAMQVAKRVHHADQAERGEQEDQRMSQRQVVVDGTDEQRQENDGKQQSAAVGQDVDGAPAERARRQLWLRCGKEPPPVRLCAGGAGVHLPRLHSGNGDTAQQAGDVFKLRVAALLRGAQAMAGDGRQHRLHVIRNDHVAAVQPGPGAGCREQGIGYRLDHDAAVNPFFFFVILKRKRF